MVNFGRRIIIFNYNIKNMKTIELNEQAVQWLIEHLNLELEGTETLEDNIYSETSKGIMRHLLEKLTKE